MARGRAVNAGPGWVEIALHPSFMGFDLALSFDPGVDALLVG
jgi:hypothetical protein